MHGYMGRYVTAMGGTLSQARQGKGQGRGRGSRRKSSDGQGLCINKFGGFPAGSYYIYISIYIHILGSHDRLKWPVFNQRLLLQAAGDHL